MKPDHCLSFVQSLHFNISVSAVTWFLFYILSSTGCSHGNIKNSQENTTKTASTDASTSAGEATGSNSVQTSKTPDRASDTTEPSLSPGFLIQISTAQDKTVSGQYRISEDGDLNLPYQVEINVRGKTLKDLEGLLSKAYRPYFRSEPDIKVTVKQKRYYVTVGGLVAKPGTFLVEHESTLDELLAMAGGTEKDVVNTGYVRIDHRKTTQVTHGESKETLKDRRSNLTWIGLQDYYEKGKTDTLPKWVGGEHIFIQKERPDLSKQDTEEQLSSSVHVMGEVRNPGLYSLAQGADAYYYLSKSGGPTQAVDFDRVEVVRYEAKQGQFYSNHFSSINNIRDVREGDLLLFHSVRQSSFERTLQTTAVIAGIFSSIITTALLISVTAQ